MSDTPKFPPPADRLPVTLAEWTERRDVVAASAEHLSAMAQKWMVLAVNLLDAEAPARSLAASAVVANLIELRRDEMDAVAECNVMIELRRDEEAAF